MELKKIILNFWPELLAILVFIFSFSLAIFSKNIFISSITAICISAVSARIIYFKFQDQPIGPSYLVVIALFIGFILGSFSDYVLFIIVLILLSFFVSYYLHEKKMIQTFKNKPFIK